MEDSRGDSRTKGVAGQAAVVRPFDVEAGLGGGGGGAKAAAAAAGGGAFADCSHGGSAGGGAGFAVSAAGYPWQAYAALFACVLQTVGAIVLMRYSRRRRPAAPPGEPAPPAYFTTTAVVLAEAVKLVCAAVLMYREEWAREKAAGGGGGGRSGNSDGAFGTSDGAFGTSDGALGGAGGPAFGGAAGGLLLRLTPPPSLFSPREFMRAGVPGLLYAVQNNLIYKALSNLSAATYQISYQLKILSTALLSVAILHRRYSSLRWVALVVLTAGVALIAVATEAPAAAAGAGADASFAVGMAAVLSACATSGLAGVYLEKILKDSRVSLWARNVQLAVYGVFFGLFLVYSREGGGVAEFGFFHGYDGVVVALVLLQSAGGIIIALVLKFADNVLKCFANAAAIVLSVCASRFLFAEIGLSPLFATGAGLVLLATLAYTLDDKFLAFVRRYLVRPLRRRARRRSRAFNLAEEKSAAVLPRVAQG